MQDTGCKILDNRIWGLGNLGIEGFAMWDLRCGIWDVRYGKEDA
jgi:hypothetical protein